MGKVVATVQVNGNEVYLVKEGNKYLIYWGEAKQEGKAAIELLTPTGRKPSESSAYKKFLQAVKAAQYLKFERL
jgi:hypothetical protein